MLQLFRHMWEVFIPAMQRAVGSAPIMVVLALIIQMTLEKNTEFVT